MQPYDATRTVSSHLTADSGCIFCLLIRCQMDFAIVSCRYIGLISQKLQLITNCLLGTANQLGVVGYCFDEAIILFVILGRVAALLMFIRLKCVFMRPLVVVFFNFVQKFVAGFMYILFLQREQSMVCKGQMGSVDGRKMVD